ncbi:MAG TPA: hypothetical protein VI197_31355, partial [Polyangiaceae bacterium]
SRRRRNADYRGRIAGWHFSRAELRAPRMIVCRAVAALTLLRPFTPADERASMTNQKHEREREPYKRKLIADFPSGILLSVSVRDLEEMERPDRDDESDES